MPKRTTQKRRPAMAPAAQVNGNDSEAVYSHSANGDVDGSLTTRDTNMPTNAPPKTKEMMFTMPSRRRTRNMGKASKPANHKEYM
jgi:hypothetical protein